MSFLNIKKNKEKNKEKNPGHRAGIVCCSNGQPPQAEKTLENLREYLSGIGLEPVFTEYIYQKNSVFSGTARQRAESLMSFYRDPEISVIFDISGGDLANEVLPYLDYDVIASSGKEFWGSGVTAI